MIGLATVTIGTPEDGREFDWDGLLSHLAEQPQREGWVTLDEAVNACGVARSTLRSWYRSGQVPSRMVPGIHGPQRLVASACCDPGPSVTLSCRASDWVGYIQSRCAALVLSNRVVDLDGTITTNVGPARPEACNGSVGWDWNVGIGLDVKSGCKTDGTTCSLKATSSSQGWDQVCLEGGSGFGGSPAIITTYWAMARRSLTGTLRTGTNRVWPALR